MFDETTRIEILRRFDRLSPERPPLWGRLTASQMLAHVSDQLRMALGDIHTSHGSGFLASRAGAWLMIYVIPECDVNADWPEHP